MVPVGAEGRAGVGGWCVDGGEVVAGDGARAALIGVDDGDACAGHAGAHEVVGGPEDQGDSREGRGGRDGRGVLVAGVDDGADVHGTEGT